MPCLPRRSLKHCCSTTDRGETPIPDLPVGFSHKCHAALHVTKTVQSQHLTFSSQLCKHDASYWANMCRVCRNFANTPNMGKVYRNVCKHFRSTGQNGKAYVLTTLNTQILRIQLRIRCINLKHQDLQRSWASWGQR